MLTDLSRCFASPVWEPFHGTLYHKSVLTLALPLTQHLPSSTNQSPAMDVMTEDLGLHSYFKQGLLIQFQCCVRVCPRLGVYVTSRYLWSSDVSMRGHSRGMGPC